MWTVEDWEKMVRVLGEIVRERSDKRGKHSHSARVKGLKKYPAQASGRKASIRVAGKSV